MGRGPKPGQTNSGSFRKNDPRINRSGVSKEINAARLKAMQAAALAAPGAVAELESILENPTKEGASVAIAAADKLLDRGLGKAPQTIEHVFDADDHVAWVLSILEPFPEAIDAILAAIAADDDADD